MVLAAMFGVALIVSVFRIPANAIDHRAARGERDAASKDSGVSGRFSVNLVTSTALLGYRCGDARGAGADANDLR
jgi:hypothetical protein